MSFPDEVIELGFELLTETPMNDVRKDVKQNPMKEKKHLAFEIVSFLWGEKNAIHAQNIFEQTFQERRPEFNIKVNSGNSLSDTITYYNYLHSKSEAKRQIKNRAVEINGQVVLDVNYIVKAGDEIKVGSRTFLKAK